MNKPLAVIYHGNCTDGFMSATIVRKAFGKKADKGIDFHAGVHQEDPPDVTGKAVIFVDFSYKRAVVEKMAKTAKSIWIVDHHASAMEDLKGMKEIKTSFDMNRSGAGLAWDIFMKGKPRPKIVDYVEDIDLWRLELPQSKEVAACIRSYDYDFDLWTGFLDADQNKLISNMKKDGEGIERKHIKDIKEHIAVGEHELTIAGKKVPVVNLPYTMASEAAGMLAQNAPFAAAYTIVGEWINFSLRSRNNTDDVSKVAMKYGGGGHPQAAGFRVKNTGKELARELAKN